MTLASRLADLGTETAFAVSAQASDWASKGHRIFPFHLGDIDLATPANIVQAASRAIRDGMTGYCPAPGILELREALAHDVGARRGITVHPDEVVVQPGGKPVITKFLQIVMNPGDEVLYPNPGYPIYESQIDYLGGIAKPYRYIAKETGFAIDLDHLETLITPDTKALIYNDLQNPLGAESSHQERKRLADLAQRHDLWVLSDEAYFETRYSGTSQSIASLPGMQHRTVILYTFSKKYAMTGWRLGATIAPREVAAVIGKLNTNNESCTTHFVQWAGVEALRGEQDGAQAIVEELRARRNACARGLKQIPGLSLVVPDATFYLFPDVTDLMAAKGIADLADFATQALHATGVSFCHRLHFGRAQAGETRAYLRFAYSGLPVSAIEEGMALLRDWAAS